MKAEDYDVVKVIGRGAFGEVQLVRICFVLFIICFDDMFCETFVSGPRVNLIFVSNHRKLAL